MLNRKPVHLAMRLAVELLPRHQVMLQQHNKIPQVKLMLLAKPPRAQPRRRPLEVRLLLPLANQMPHTAKLLNLPANQVLHTNKPLLRRANLTLTGIKQALTSKILQIVKRPQIPANRMRTKGKLRLNQINRLHLRIQH
jgi:hypothetical protein